MKQLWLEIPQTKTASLCPFAWSEKYSLLQFPASPSCRPTLPCWSAFALVVSEGWSATWELPDTATSSAHSLPPPGQWQEAPVRVLHPLETTPPSLQPSHLASAARDLPPPPQVARTLGQSAQKGPQLMGWRHFLSAIKWIIYYHNLFLRGEWLVMDICSSHPSSSSPSVFPPPPHISGPRRFHGKEEGGCTLSGKSL